MQKIQHGQSSLEISTNSIQVLGVPVNVIAPSITPATSPVDVGTTLVLLNGNWTNSPTSWAYGWMRNGTAIGGASTNVYDIVDADAGTIISGVVMGINAAGGGIAVATSNTITINDLVEP